MWLVFEWPAHNTLEAQTSALWQTTWKLDHKTHVNEEILLLQGGHKNNSILI